MLYWQILAISVDIAMKMVLRYYHSLGDTSKKAPEVRLIVEKDVEKLVEKLDAKPFAKIINEHHSEISGVVMESIVQGAGGLRMYHPYFLKRVRELCNQFNIFKRSSTKLQ
ncbi:CPA_1a_G0000910.mRNA.1.CDS.1 [Saccharomyces cerevisiae]|nr:CPA_1a_G0000910.mRNA.1.CDS.1 [Saccharomyces cerevisiae]CAI7129755.1 CPA_1a_G0000910.mRNA.1.CDS.1 [Saccharomyces cerevisiae]